MREDPDAEFASGLLYRLLHVGFMHPVTIFKVGAGMETGVVGGEEPGPGPGELIFGVFDTELMGQGDGDMVLLVPQPNGLATSFVERARGPMTGDGHHPIFPGLGTHDEKR